MRWFYKLPLRFGRRVSLRAARVSLGGWSLSPCHKCAFSVDHSEKHGGEPPMAALPAQRQAASLISGHRRTSLVR